MFKNNPLLFIIAVILIPIGVGIIILLAWYLSCKATKLEIIGNDVILETGLLSKDRTELQMSAIRTVKVSQSFFNRIFGVGKISIYTAGDRPEIVANGIPDPHEFRRLIKGTP